MAAVSFELFDGEFASVVGPSGCGKSTLLNCIAGLVPYQGSLCFAGRPISGPGPDRAIVFQAAWLLPWRTVLGNVLYGLELQRFPRAEALERATRLLMLVGLGGRESSFPHQLSGGMQQRVNLARALAVDPKLLLLDEPFSALDAITRECMQEELLGIWAGSGKTALFITHQMDEAVYLSDRVFVMTRQPGKVREVLPVDLPRPRDFRMKQLPRFAELVGRIRELIRQEVGQQKPHTGEGAVLPT